MIPSNVNYRVISLVYMTTVTCHFLPAPLSHQVVRSDIQPRAWYINRSRQTKIKNRIERNATSFCPQILFWVSSPMCPPVTWSSFYPVISWSWKNAWRFTSTNPTARIVWHSGRKVSLFLLLAGSQSSQLSCFFTYSFSQKSLLWNTVNLHYNAGLTAYWERTWVVYCCYTNIVKVLYAVENIFRVKESNIWISGVPTNFVGGVQQIQLRTEKMGIWGQ